MRHAANASMEAIPADAQCSQRSNLRRKLVPVQSDIYKFDARHSDGCGETPDALLGQSSEAGEPARAASRQASDAGRRRHDARLHRRSPDHGQCTAGFQSLNMPLRFCFHTHKCSS